MRRRHHAPVTLGQARVRQRQFAEFIFPQAIHPGLIKHKIGPELPHPRQILVERGQILLIARPIGEVHVDRARLFAEREVVAAVKRERQHVRILREQRRRAVPLVHVEVDYRHARAPPAPPQIGNRNRNVVEDAKAGTFGPVGVVRTAHQRPAAAALLRRLRRRQRPAHARERTHNQRRRPREPDAANGRRRQLPGEELPHVLGVMRPADLFAGSQRRRVKREAAIARQRLPQQTVLARRKPVVRRQAHVVVITVVEPQQRGYRLVRSRIRMSLKRMSPAPPECSCSEMPPSNERGRGSVKSTSNTPFRRDT